MPETLPTEAELLEVLKDMPCDFSDDGVLATEDSEETDSEPVQ